MLGAVMFGHREMQQVIDAIIRLAEKAAKEPRAVPDDVHAPMRAKIKAVAGSRSCRPRSRSRSSSSAATRIDEIRKKTCAGEFVGEGEGKVAAKHLRQPVHDVEADVMRNAVLDTRKRIDGRDLDTVRPIVAEVGILPRTHGSALFTRGETQALVVTTLGTGEDEQFVDSLEGTYKQTLHAALQLPSLFGRRNRPHGRARPPRNRPWQARLARDPSDAADEGRVPLHASASCPRSPNRTARPRWRRCAAPRWR